VHAENVTRVESGSAAWRAGSSWVYHAVERVRRRRITSKNDHCTGNKRTKAALGLTLSSPERFKLNAGYRNVEHGDHKPMIV